MQKSNMTQREYEEDLRIRQEKHLRSFGGLWDDAPYVACMHDQCSQCIGTGVKHDGSMCIHHLSCNCPKCTPR